MSWDGLNRWIVSYLSHSNLTGKAIMLSGGWGTGKSFYILDNLKPLLERTKCRLAQLVEKVPYLKKCVTPKCIVVSLYGINSIRQLNVVVYSRFRLNNYWYRIPKFLSSIVFLTITGLCYSIYKDFHCGWVGIVLWWFVISFLLSIFNFKSIEFEETVQVDDIKALGTKLSTTLIILEDVERTNLDIKELFGWVTSLCEGAGAKILLVANEKKLEEKLDDKQKKFYEQEKEKTVSATLQFQADFKRTVYSIIKNKFNSKRSGKQFKGFTSIDAIKNICSLDDDDEHIQNSKELKEMEMYLTSSVSNVPVYAAVLEHFNYRFLIYRFQLLVDIFDEESKEAKRKNIKETSQDFKKRVLMLSVCFAHNDSHPGSHVYHFQLQSVLGSKEYAKIQPFINDPAVITTRNFITSGFSCNDDVIVLYNFHNHTDFEISNAIDSLLNMLREPVNEISSYLSIMLYLSIIKYDYCFEDNGKIGEVKKALESNMQENQEIINCYVRNLDVNELSWYSINEGKIKNGEGKKYFDDFRKEFFDRFKIAYTQDVFNNLINKIVGLQGVSVSQFIMLNFPDMAKYILSFSPATLFNLCQIVERFKSALLTAKPGDIFCCDVIERHLKAMKDAMCDNFDKTRGGLYVLRQLQVYQTMLFKYLEDDIDECLKKLGQIKNKYGT